MSTMQQQPKRARSFNAATRVGGFGQGAWFASIDCVRSFCAQRVASLSWPVLLSCVPDLQKAGAPSIRGCRVIALSNTRRHLPMLSCLPSSRPYQLVVPNIKILLSILICSEPENRACVGAVLVFCAQHCGEGGTGDREPELGEGRPMSKALRGPITPKTNSRRLRAGWDATSMTNRLGRPNRCSQSSVSSRPDRMVTNQTVSLTWDLRVHSVGFTVR